MHHVLVVDDHADIRRLLSITLGKLYSVIEVDNGVAALEAVQKYHPKVVLLDVMMPGEIDGIQVLQSIKRDPKTKDIIVAMVTARGQLTDNQLAMQNGADAYFVKPFSPLQLVNWVKEHCK